MVEKEEIRYYKREYLINSDIKESLRRIELLVNSDVAIIDADPKWLNKEEEWKKKVHEHISALYQLLR